VVLVLCTGLWDQFRGEGEGEGEEDDDDQCHRSAEELRPTPSAEELVRCDGSEDDEPRTN
jgi:hypothetical protein